LILACLAASSCSSADKATQAKISVASDATYRPFEYIDDKTGGIIGFDIDIIKAIAAQQNINIEITNVPWVPLLAGITEGTYDCAISSIVITEDRKKDMLFSAPYFPAGQTIVVRSDNTDITGKDTLNGLVGVQQNTAGEIEVQKIKTAESRSYQDIGSAFQDLLNGRIKAVVYDNPVSTQYVNNNAGKLKLAGAPFTDESYGIAVYKGRPDLLKKINAGLKAVKAQGVIEKAAADWLK
jgi:polar amino acid transport system substrate-binding protein